MRRARIAVIAYAAATLATYGYAAGTYERAAWARYSACQSVSLNTPDAVPDCRVPWTIDAPAVGLVSAALWPLYWAWVAADEVRS